MLSICKLAVVVVLHKMAALHKLVLLRTDRAEAALVLRKGRAEVAEPVVLLRRGRAAAVHKGLAAEEVPGDHMDHCSPERLHMQPGEEQPGHKDQRSNERERHCWGCSHDHAAGITTHGGCPRAQA